MGHKKWANARSQTPPGRPKEIPLSSLKFNEIQRNSMKFNDFGNMTIAEIDQLFAILFEKKRQGHFSGFWTSVPQSVDFMKTKRVNIQSMFSPGVSALNGQGIPVTYASPKEGYRAWHGVMCLSKSKTEFSCFTPKLRDRGVLSLEHTEPVFNTGT